MSGVCRFQKRIKERRWPAKKSYNYNLIIRMLQIPVACFICSFSGGISVKCTAVLADGWQLFSVITMNLLYELALFLTREAHAQQELS